jgi:hypothetical protein
MTSPALAAAARAADRKADQRPVRALGGLLPFIRPYRGRIALAGLFLVLAAVTTLLFPVALKTLIDQGLVAADPGQRVMALRSHFVELFAVGAALGLFSAARFYMVTWLGERITADLRNAVYAHVVQQSPEFFESTQTGEVLSRLTTDTTLVQDGGGQFAEHGPAQHRDGHRRGDHARHHQPLGDGPGDGHPGAGGAAQPVLRPPRAQAQPRQPGPCGRQQRHCRRGAERHSGGAELRAGRARGCALRRQHRKCLRHGAQAHARARHAGGLHHHRHLRRAAVGACTRARRP